MPTKELLNRINYLSKKSKEVGLNATEKKEQESLRKEYLEGFKASFVEQITSVKVLDPEGNDVTPEKVKRIKESKK